MKVVVIPHLLLHLTTPWDPVDYWALDVDLIAMHKVSLLPTAGNQALWAQQPAIIPFIPMLLKTARCPAVSLNPINEGDGAVEDGNAEEDKGGIETSSDRQVALDGRSALIPKTSSPALVRSLVDTRTQTQSQTPERKSSPSGKSAKENSPLKESSESSSSEEELPTDEALCDGAR